MYGLVSYISYAKKKNNNKKQPKKKKTPTNQPNKQTKVSVSSVLYFLFLISTITDSIGPRGLCVNCRCSPSNSLNMNK